MGGRFFQNRKDLFWFAIALVLLGTVGSLLAVNSRIGVDKSYGAISILMDWHSLASLPDASGGSISYPENNKQSWELIKALPGAQLCYGEETVGSLLDSGIFLPAELATGSPAYEVTDERYSADIARGAARHGYPYRRIDRFGSGIPETGGAVSRLAGRGSAHAACGMVSGCTGCSF